MRLIALFLFSACSNPLNVLGEDAADSVLLAEAGPLAHLGLAMGTEGATASDLFDVDLAFDEAPDPTAWLASEHAAHAALEDGTGQTLSVLTYNTGLLNRTYLLSRVQVPFTDERAAVMGDEVFGAGHDIIFLQEVWEVEDAERIEATAESLGYTVTRSDTNKLQRKTGLVIAVRSELVTDILMVDVVQYDAQWGSENFPGPNLKRIGVSNALRSVPRAADFHSESRESIAGADSARADSAVVPRAPPNRARAHPVVAHDRTHSGVLRLRRIRRGCQAGLGRPRCPGRPGCATWPAATEPRAGSLV
jgi:hypothetical protein